MYLIAYYLFLDYRI